MRPLRHVSRKPAKVTRGLAKQVGALSDIIGFGIEEIARVVVFGWLLRHEGIVMTDEFVRRWVVVDSGGLRSTYTAKA